MNPPDKIPSLIYGCSVVINVTTTISNPGSHDKGHFIGESGKALEFKEATRSAQFGGNIRSAVLIDNGNQAQAIDLWLFDSFIVPPNDNDIWNVSSDDMKHCVGVIPFETFYVSASNCISFARDIELAFATVEPNTSLFGCLVSGASSDRQSGDITVRMVICQN